MTILYLILLLAILVGVFLVVKHIIRVKKESKRNNPEPDSKPNKDITYNSGTRYGSGDSYGSTKE